MTDEQRLSQAAYLGAFDANKELQECKARCEELEAISEANRSISIKHQQMNSEYAKQLQQFEALKSDWLDMKQALEFYGALKVIKDEWGLQARETLQQLKYKGAEG